MTFARRLGVLLVCAWIAGCPAQEDPADGEAPGVDAGGRDAGIDRPDDAGRGSDAGSRDAGAIADAGSSDDAGTVDAGGPSDAGTDAGTCTTDVDDDGFASEACGGSDCDDADDEIHPGRAERCDGEDQDCDDAIDEDAIDATLFYRDADSDGFGDPDDGASACAAPTGRVAFGLFDCDDSAAELHPDVLETCDSIDQDCDGRVDETTGCGSIGASTFLPSDVTLFGVVARDPVSGANRARGFGYSAAQITVTDTGDGAAWSVDSAAAGAMPVEAFAVARDPRGGSSRRGSIALQWDSVLESMPEVAAALVGNQSTVLRVAVPGTVGLHLLWVHLRALPPLELVVGRDGGAAIVRGTGIDAVYASGPPRSSAVTAGAPWSEIVWSSPFGAAPTPVLGGARIVGGVGGAFSLALSTAEPPPSPDVVGAIFDGITLHVLPGSEPPRTVRSFDAATTGVTPKIVEDLAPATASLAGVPSSVTLSPGVATHASFDVEVSDPHYVSLSDVVVRLRWIARAGRAAPPESVYTFDGTSWALRSALPSGVAVTMPPPTVAAADRPSVDPSAWGGAYSNAANSAVRFAWTDVDVALSTSDFERIVIVVQARDQARNPRARGEASIEILE